MQDIFKRRAKNLKIMKTNRVKRIRFLPKSSPFFCPDLCEDQKKGLHQDFSSPIFCPNLKRGWGVSVTQFCALFVGIYALLAPQVRGPWHHAPPKYAPASRVFSRNCLTFHICTKYFGEAKQPI